MKTDVKTISLITALILSTDRKILSRVRVVQRLTALLASRFILSRKSSGSIFDSTREKERLSRLLKSWRNDLKGRIIRTLYKSIF